MRVFVNSLVAKAILEITIYYDYHNLCNVKQLKSNIEKLKPEKPSFATMGHFYLLKSRLWAQYFSYTRLDSRSFPLYTNITVNITYNNWKLGDNTTINIVMWQQWTVYPDVIRSSNINSKIKQISWRRPLSDDTIRLLGHGKFLRNTMTRKSSVKCS